MAREFFSLGAAGFASGADDPIMNMFTESVDGQVLLKVVRRSGKCGYVTSRGISAKPENATELSGVQTITVNTYEELQEYNFKAGVPVYINVLEDEDKSQPNTSYSWTGAVLKWNAENINSWQPNEASL